MLGEIKTPILNKIIESLPENERENLLVDCELVELKVGTVLCEQNIPFQHVYFPLNGFISLVSEPITHQTLEMGIIGYEGMLGATLCLGVNTAPMLGLVRGDGSALRITVEKLLIQLQNSPELAMQLNHYLYVLITQISLNASCTHFHETEPRLSRWLLMMHDRVQVNHLHLTHSFLASMLGVRRSSITIAAGALQKRKLICYTRGEITILDRAGLEASACECYKIAKHDYARLLT